MTAPARFLPVAAALFTGIQVGAALVVSRYVIDQITPANLAMLRYAIGFLCLAPAVVLISRQGFKRQDIIPICALGIFQFGILVALLNYAVRFLPSAQVALIFSTFPLQTLVLAFLLGKETITFTKTLGVLLTIAGVAVTLGPDLFSTSSSDMEWTAILAVLCSAFIGAVCSIFYRPFLDRYPAQNVSTLAMLASVIVLFGYSAARSELASIELLNAAGWSAVLFIGLSSGAGYFAWLWALKYLPPTRVTIFLSLGPISSTVLGAFFLAEPVTLPLIAGIGLVVTGLSIGFK